MHFIKLLGQSLMARDFERQGAEIQIRIAVRNRYTALGIPVTEPTDQVHMGKGEERPSPDLCNKATGICTATCFGILCLKGYRKNSNFSD